MGSRVSMAFTLVALIVSVSLAPAQEPAAAPAPASDTPSKRPTEIRLIARADDMGAAQAINEGCIQAYTEGIVRSVEVIVPGPWFLDAVRLIKENPGVDVGVHLTLTSEWDHMKWRSLTNSPSLCDPNGYFHPNAAAFTANRPDLQEVEDELRAQIEVAKRHLGDRVTHLSAHMGAATATPPIKAITDKLAKEYKLRTDDGMQRAPTFGDRTFANDRRRNALVEMLEKLEPGDWLLVEHPAYDTPETRGLSHKGYENVATDRANVRRAFADDAVKAVVKKRGIKLIGYKDL